MVMEKFKVKSRKVVAGLRAEVNYEIAVKTNEVSRQLMELKDHVAADVKKWMIQRSNMQLDIKRLTKEIWIMQGQPGLNYDQGQMM